MPALPVCVLGPVWAQFVVLLPDHPAVAPARPLGRHRKRIPDRVVFDHVVAALVPGPGCERIATPGCSDRTIRRRVRAWAAAGAAERLPAEVLAQYDRPIGPDLDELAVDGRVTKAPCGGERAGRSPVERGKQGLQRSTPTGARGIPLLLVSAGAYRRDAPLLAPARRLLDGRGITAVVARRGVPAPPQVGGRWVVGRTQSWTNGFGARRRCTERSGIVADFYPFLAAAVVTTRRLINKARTRFRWDDRPATRGLT